MEMNSFINWVYGLITLFVLGFACFAEEITTGNLLPNGTNNASSYQTVDSTIPNVTSNGFTTSGNIQSWGQEIEVTGTGGINVTGSLVDITTGEDTTTQDKLDNGVTLNSTTIVQNCEYQGSNWQCGQAKPGQDTYTTTVKILDSSGNVLATVNQVRNNDAGYGNNAFKYSDSVAYTGTGSNQFYWGWEGVDLGYDTYGTSLGGPNLLGAKLTMTYDNVVIEQEVIEELEEVIEEFVEWEEQFVEPTIAPPTIITLPIEIEELEELTLEEPQVIEMIEELTEELEEEFEEVEILQIIEPVIEEEIEEPSMQEEVAIEEELMEEEMMEEVEEIAMEEEITEEATETVATEEELVEETPTEEVVAEKEVATEEEISTVEEPTETVAEQEVEVKQDFSVDVADVEAKVKEKIASVEKQLQAISIIGAKAMAKTQADISSYTKKNADLFDNREIYINKTYKDVVLLDEYMIDIYSNDNRFALISGNDPVLKYQNDLREVRIKRKQAEYELRKVRGY